MVHSLCAVSTLVWHDLHFSSWNTMAACTLTYLHNDWCVVYVCCFDANLPLLLFTDAVPDELTSWRT